MSDRPIIPQQPADTPPEPTDAPAEPAGPVPWRRYALVSVAAFAAGLALLGVVVATLVRLAPAWWRSVMPSDPAVIARAQRLENRVTNRLYDARVAPGRPSEPWTIEVDAASANAWLNVRLPRWVASRGAPNTPGTNTSGTDTVSADSPSAGWPREVRDVQVSFDEGLITLGARVGRGDSPAAALRVVTATVEPRVEPAGGLWIPARAVGLGRFDVPAPLVIRAVRTSVQDAIPPGVRDRPETQAMIRALRGESAIVADPVFRLGDGRRIRVLKIESTGGVLRVTCRTEMDPRAAASGELSPDEDPVRRGARR